MRTRILSNRATVTRTSRRDPRGPMLESLAAEFALLAQRRARMARQIDLLDRQLAAASRGLNVVQVRMSQLTHEMARIDPGLRAAVPAPTKLPAPAPRIDVPTPDINAVRRSQTVLKPQPLPRGMRPPQRPRPIQGY